MADSIRSTKERISGAEALAVLYPAHSLWLRAKRHRIRQAETGQSRERLDSLPQGDS
jgi:hypothetical protein